MSYEYKNCKPVDDPRSVELEIVECACGFHLGVDATFLLQVGAVTVACPSCQLPMTIPDDE